MKKNEQLKISDFIELNDNELKIIMGGAYSESSCGGANPDACENVDCGHGYDKDIDRWFNTRCERYHNACECRRENYGVG